jgi:eukaryotic-like serine/threonine-protein kinase
MTKRSCRWLWRASAIAGLGEKPDTLAVADSLRVWNKTGTQPLDGLRGLTTRDFAIWFAQRLSSALSHAHVRGIIHGDIKPANVLIRNDGEPAFIDFNLSRDDDAPAPQIVGGTLPYMAPEQLESLLSRRSMTSPASDVYSLGIVLYELIEGRLPFRAPQSMSENGFSSGAQRTPASNAQMGDSSVSLGLRSIVTKCLAWETELRYRSRRVAA